MYALFLVKFFATGHHIIEVKKMYHDGNEDKMKNSAVIPVQNMIDGSSVIFFGEDPGVIGDDSENDVREKNIRRLSD